MTMTWMILLEVLQHTETIEIQPKLNFIQLYKIRKEWNVPFKSLAKCHYFKADFVDSLSVVNTKFNTDSWKGEVAIRLEYKNKNLYDAHKEFIILQSVSKLSFF